MRSPPPGMSDLQTRVWRNMETWEIALLGAARIAGGWGSSDSLRRILIQCIEHYLALRSRIKAGTASAQEIADSHAWRDEIRHWLADFLIIPRERIELALLTPEGDDADIMRLIE